MKSFSNKTLIFFLQKVLFLLHFRSSQNCMSSANLVAENYLKLCNKRVLSTGEPCTCDYFTLLQSFHRSTLSIHLYIAQKDLENLSSEYSIPSRPYSWGVFEYSPTTSNVVKIVSLLFSPEYFVRKSRLSLI